MKKKHIAIIMGIILTAATLSGCRLTKNIENNDSQTTEQPVGKPSDTQQDSEKVSEENTESLLGEVTAVSENSITIALGTRKQMERPEDNQNMQDDKPEENTKPEDNIKPQEDIGKKRATANGEHPSMLELTGEEQTITVTENTVITKVAQRGGMGAVEGGSGDLEPSREQQAETITLSQITEGDTVTITLDQEGNAVAIMVESMGMAGASGSEQNVTDYQSVQQYTENTTIESEEINSQGTNENAVLVSHETEVSLKNVTVNRTSADSTGGDNASFYGVGAAILGTKGTTYISGSTIATDAAGGAGVFAYGDGKIYVSDSIIATQQDTSGGIHVAGGGSLYAWNLDVTTNGESSAAIRSDRGGGTMVAEGGSYTSNGVGSPAVYCTADIAVKDSTLTANGSEAVCIEGLNSLRMYDCDITGNMSDDAQNDCTWTLIVYQSMSGDSQVGNSTLQIDGGSIRAENGGLIYTTNTECTITMKDVDITYNDDSEFFLQCTGNHNKRGWGSEGSNGSDCSFTAITQDMEGDVIWDSISKLDFYITSGSHLNGAFVQEESYSGDEGEGYCNVVIEQGSVWTVTKDSRLSSLSVEGDIVDATGKTVSVVGSDGTVYVEGESQYTITVDRYSQKADLSGATTIDDYAEYVQEKPLQIA
ncbi:MAG: hypothetical protein K2M46_03860 [Lachnospiraceae bacterium]|nr:hypothetical protein [Lachnospiraceae bacterium]